VIVDRRTLCRFWLGYCGVVVSVDGDQVVAVRGDRQHPVSRGYQSPSNREHGHDPGHR
jgi:Molybdopterin oxidoreductase Fe4S4 domain